MFRALSGSLLLFVALIQPVFAEQLIISGSTSVSRLMDILAESYTLKHPDQIVAVQGIGSSAGITLVNKGVSELGMSSRYLTESESSEELKVFPIAYDGLAVVVNHSNLVSNLTREQLFDVYQGKITNWKTLSGEDKPIAVVTREASSGSRYSFENLIGLTKIINDKRVSSINPNNLVVNSNSMVKTIVNHNTQAIGFISMGSIDASIKAINFDGIEPTSTNIFEHKYQLVRPFLVFHRQETDSDNVASFTAYLLSNEGQAIVEQYGYSRVSLQDTYK